MWLCTVYLAVNKKVSAASHGVTLDLNIALSSYSICPMHVRSNVFVHIFAPVSISVWAPVTVCKWSAVTESVFQWQLQSDCASCKPTAGVCHFSLKAVRSQLCRENNTYMVSNTMLLSLQWGTHGNRLSFWIVICWPAVFWAVNNRLSSYCTEVTACCMQLRLQYRVQVKLEIAYWFHLSFL